MKFREERNQNRLKKSPWRTGNVNWNLAFIHSFTKQSHPVHHCVRHWKSDGKQNKIQYPFSWTLLAKR